MPTIDQLAPTTAASDDDQLVVSQSGVARKVTRAQVLAGVQPEVAIGQGKLLGRSSIGVGGPEQINVGTNLSLTNGTLSANATPFVVASLTAGTVPVSGDLVPLGQNGGNVAVTYSQFMNGLAGIANVDVSQLLVTPTGGKSPAKLGDFTASTLPLSGGTLTGALTLAADPISTLQAATKKYVDTQVATTLPKTGGTLSGILTLSGDPTASLQSATKQYVDGQVATSLSKSGGTLTGALTVTGALTLAGDPTGSLQATTKQYVDTQVGTALPKAGGALSGALTLAGDPTLSLQPATKQYVDGQISSALPRSGGTLSGALMLAADPAASLQAATKQYVDARVSRSGDTLTGSLVLVGDPTASLQAATKQYVDSQVGTTLPKAGGTLTGALTLVADPSSSMHASTKHYVDAQVAVSLPLGGGTLAGPLTLSANPTSALQASPKQYVDSQVATALPVIGGTLTGALTLAADPTSSLHAATKRYVDAASGVSTGVINVRSSPYNAQLNGVTDDTAAFKAAYQAARAGSVIYVPNGTTVLQNPGNWGISLTKRVKWVVDGTSLPDGTALADGIPGGGSPANNFLPGIIVGNSGQSAAISQTGSQGSDFSVQHSSYVVNHSGGPTGGAVISNARNDTIIYSAPNNFVWGGLDRLLWCGTQTPSATNAVPSRKWLKFGVV